MTTTNLVRYIDKVWLLNKFGNHPTRKSLKEELKKELKISDTMATLLLNRGLDTKEKAADFLYGGLDKLHSPFLMKDMKKAVERVKLAIENNEKIAAFTDFDCDGTTSNASFGIAFEKLLKYKNLILYIPHREKEGYGLNTNALQKLKDEGVSLVISADIGITAYKEADFCKQIGLDLIITDHHLPKLPENYNKDDEDQFQFLPQAYALVNPNRPDDTYPFKGVCGCGVAYKFLVALWVELGRDTKELDILIPIVAVATVADIVPLVDENRIIVKEGLKMMNQPDLTGIVGLDALIRVAGLNHIDADSIGFGIAPRINSAGRLEHAMLASELLRTEDKEFALVRAKEIDGLNNQRKELQKAVIEKVYEQITESYLEENTAICIHVEEVNPGVVGIAAGQVTERLHRPSIVVTDHPELKDYYVGSARSISTIHILEVMNQCKDAWDKNDPNEKFGGHAQAAGMTIHKKNFPKLQKKIQHYFMKNPVSKEDLMPRLMLDKPVRIEDINFNLMDEIDFLAPYGEKNPKPYFGLKGIETNVKFWSNNTLGVVCKDNYKRSVRGVGYSMQDKAKDLGLQDNIYSTLDIAFQPSWNEYNNMKTVQMTVADFRLSN